MNLPTVPPKRCAVYCRVSSDERLDQSFNSIDAQREAGRAYLHSQRAEEWIPVDDRFEDGGYSGGNMERPALRRLLADIELGKVDVVVVYKIDRLSRAVRLRADGRGVRPPRRVFRVSHAAVQHHDLDGTADAQRAALLRAVRA